MRLAKAISHAGICSRRDAEEMIKTGKVKVDGQLVISPATEVEIDSKIEVAGKSINQNTAVRLWVYYKPKGLITTHKDTHSRATVFQNLLGLPRVISVGRLDINSEGLLLLTNNGDYARKLELPSNKIEREYIVRAYGNPEMLLSNNGSIVINGIQYNPKSIKLINSNVPIKNTKKNYWFEVLLTEGKNREIRKIFAHFGLIVNRLIRVRYGAYILGSLKPSEYKEVLPPAVISERG